MNTKGEEFIPATFDKASTFEQGMASVKLNGKFHYIDLQGRIVYTSPNDLKYDAENNVILVNIDKKTGYIDGKEKIIISLDESFSPARVVLLINSNEYLISSEGTLTAK